MQDTTRARPGTPPPRRGGAAADAAGARTDAARTGGEPAWRLWQARASLAWERLWPALWMPAALAGLFLALALANLLPLLPGWLHALVLAAFAVAVPVALYRGVRRVALPDAAAARRRLERDSGLAHRPLTALRDAPVGGDATALALWRLHQERMRRGASRLRVALPHPNLAARDPLALRMVVGLLLFVAVAGAGADWRPRLAAAVTPHFDAGPAVRPVALDLWITPPEYTGLPPIFLVAGDAAAAGATGGTAAPAAAGPVRVPAGSAVLGRVTGGGVTPTLAIGAAAVPFETVDADSFQVQAPVTAGERIAVSQDGTSLGSWPITVVPDQPPSIDFVTPPAQTDRGALRVEYVAQDDYGVTAAAGTVRLAAEEVPAALAGEPLELALALPGVAPKEARQAAFHDLTAHPWAGLPVTLRLTATDGAGQTGSSEEFPMILPERVFNHPVARAIVDLRKRLTLAPTERRPVAEGLAALSSVPGQYHNDIVAFLAMRSAAARLILDQEAGAVEAVQGLMWETALRIEDGGLSLAERDLRDAERRLAEALDRNASDEELRQLMDELQQALDRFMEAMAENLRQALERGEQVPMVPPELAQNMMNRSDLQEMMDRMREMAEAGARDAARQMLSQLQQMMENMRAGMMAQAQQNQQNQAMETLRGLQELMQRQQELMDQTFQRAQEQMNAENGLPQPGSRSPRGRGQSPSASPMTQQQAEQQEALRRQLGELMRQMGEQMGEIPQPFGRAERAMRGAGEALEQGAPGAAVPNQAQAMQELQQGMQGMAEQMMQQMAGPGMMMGPPGQPLGSQPGRGRDPLNRNPSPFGQVDSGDVKVPAEADLQRAREILDELRRRAGEYDRPQIERDYIDRLLRQF